MEKQGDWVDDQQRRLSDESIARRDAAIQQVFFTLQDLLWEYRTPPGFIPSYKQPYPRYEYDSEDIINLPITAKQAFILDLILSGHVESAGLSCSRRPRPVIMI